LDELLACAFPLADVAAIATAGAAIAAIAAPAAPAPATSSCRRFVDGIPDWLAFLFLQSCDVGGCVVVTMRDGTPQVSIVRLRWLY
jgi:hypothetical protein